MDTETQQTPAAPAPTQTISKGSSIARHPVALLGAALFLGYYLWTGVGALTTDKKAAFLREVTSDIDGLRKPYVCNGDGFAVVSKDTPNCVGTSLMVFVATPERVRVYLRLSSTYNKKLLDFARGETPDFEEPEGFENILPQLGMLKKQQG